MSEASTERTAPTKRTAPTLAARCRAPGVALALGAQVGDWRITGTLGAGGMATVYSATDDAGAEVALKIAHPGLLSDDFSPATFLREARAATAVGHAGAIGVIGIGTHDDRPYVVLEQLHGQSLGARLGAGAPLPRAIACEVVLELVGVLRAAHAAGVTHRDLKPDNVFLLVPGAGRRTKLLDWGVAHIAGEPDPFRGMIAGTLSYVAPEQIRGDELTPAADIYSLGVLAFRLLGSRLPFASPSDLQLLKLHMYAPAPRASTAWPAIPPSLDDAIAAMLAKEAAARPALDAIEAAVRTALAALTTTVSVAARVEVAARPPRRARRRTRLPRWLPAWGLSDVGSTFALPPLG